MKLTRRDALLGGAATLAAATARVSRAGAPYPSTGAATAASRLALVQAPWRAGAAVAALEPLAEALRVPKGGRPQLVLLGHGEGVAPEAAALADLAAAARLLRSHLATSVRVGDARASSTVGLLLGPAGDVLLRVARITPDVLGGFESTTATLGAPARFPVARTPFGRIGLLPGEDLFAPARVRSLVFNGAEVVLNPARELANPALDARRNAAVSIAYHHGVYVATATPARSTAGVPLATRTALTDWTGAVSPPDDDSPADVTFADLDVERLRRVRQLAVSGLMTLSQHLVPMVRDDLYGRVMQHHVEKLPRIEPGPRSAEAWRAEHARLAAWQGERRTPAEELEPVYQALMVQAPERLVRDAPDRKAATAKNIREFLAGVAPYAQQPGVRLVSFPEFAFTAAGWRTIPDIRSVALAFGGPELEQIQRFAQQNRVYVTFQQLEADPRFPGRVFNTAFVLDDTGNLVSRHRKLQCVDLFGSLPDTVPGSIYDAYVREYGIETLVQVVDTPLGKLAPMICYEMMFPEVRQLYAQQGAEVIIHMTAEGYDSITETRYAWNAARRQTAMESTAYLLCANKGDELNTPWKAIGESQFIDPYGRVVRMLAESKPGTLMARIELPVVWAARRDPAVNLAVWDRPGAYVAEYGKGVGVPNDLWAGSPDEFPYEDYAVYRQVHARLYERGIYVKPGSPASA